MPQRPHQPDLFTSAERATVRRPPRDRVLIVDGDAAARTRLAEALTTQGLTVDEARDARDAMAIAVVAPPDVVVYSVGWGSGVHQLDVLEEAVEESGSRAPAIVLTTPAWMRATRGITLRGAVRVVDLVSAIGRALSTQKA
jgi:DNA-binding NtrC family response regulator